MKKHRDIEQWAIEEIYEKRNQIVFPEYQRAPKLWKPTDKKRLIDSILIDMDIPKFYLNQLSKDEYEVIDGQQRLWAIWQFLNNEFPFETESKDKNLLHLDKKYFKDFPEDVQKTILSYRIQITLFYNASEDYLRKLFIRLQFGLILVTGEKLNASTGMMKDFIFNKMVKHPFIGNIQIKNVRFAKQTLCAQICINSFARLNNNAKLDNNDFSRTRYEDLKYFFEEYRKPEGNDLKFFNEKTKNIMDVLTVLDTSFGEKIQSITNRSYILSIYLFIEELCKSLNKTELNKAMSRFVEFALLLSERLKEEAKAGFYRKNEDLYRLGSYLSNAPGEKYQIARRHETLKNFFNHYQKTGKIMGDK